MGSTTDKIKGMADQGVGSVKEGLGKALGDKEMEAKGAAQKVKGDAERAVGKGKDAIKGVIDRA